MKGYSLTKHLFLHIQQHKINQNYIYFNGLNKKLEEYATKVIKTAYLKYKLRKTEQQYQELLKQEKSKAKEKKNKA